MVAGVDYRVGVRAGATPAAVSDSSGNATGPFNTFLTNNSGSMNTAAKTISFVNAVSLINLTNSGQGWDFTTPSGTGGTDNGWLVLFDNCSGGVRIYDCKFIQLHTGGGGSSCIKCINNTDNVDIQWCNLDASSLGTVVSGFIAMFSSYTSMTVQYNWMENTGQQFVSHTNNAGLIYKYNLLVNGSRFGDSVEHLNFLINSGPGLSITNVDSGAGGVIRITINTPVTADTVLNNGDSVYVGAVVGTVGSNSPDGSHSALNVSTANQTPFIITKLSSTQFSLNGTTFSGAYTSGGSIRRSDGSSANKSLNVQFNTTYMEPQIGGGEGFQFHCTDSGSNNGTNTNPILQYNTMIAYPSMKLHPAVAWATGAAKIYADTVTATNAPYVNYHCTQAGNTNGTAQPSFMSTTITANSAASTPGGSAFGAGFVRLTVSDTTWAAPVVALVPHCNMWFATASYAGSDISGSVWNKLDTGAPHSGNQYAVVDATHIDINTSFINSTVSGTLGARIGNIQDGSDSNFKDTATGGLGVAFGSFPAGVAMWIGADFSHSFIIHGTTNGNPGAFGNVTTVLGTGICASNFFDPRGAAFGTFYGNTIAGFFTIPSPNKSMVDGSTITPT
jgi:hypothetical protein